jgi:two-component system response regulator YesN
LILRIIIADDEPIERMVLHKIIQDSRLPATILDMAKSGNEVLRQAEAHQPDLIFMDIRMPGMNGIEASSIIKKKSPNTMICIVTAFDEFQYAKQAIDNHIDYFLLKPVDLSELERVIKECRERNGSSFDLHVNTNISPSRRKLAEDIINYLHEHYSEPIHLESIGEHLNVSPQYLSRIFKMVYNMTVMNYLTVFRIQQSIHLLKNSDFSISAISEMIGFSDSSHFGQTFKKLKGKTPFQFRIQ